MSCITDSKMDPKVKAAWLRALRSGKYKQGRETLCQARTPENPAKWCCLGVLADVAVDGEWEFFDNEYEQKWVLKITDALDDTVVCDTSLPGYILRELGLTAGTQERLIDLNDGTVISKGKSFKQIAKWIEENIG